MISTLKQFVLHMALCVAHRILSALDALRLSPGLIQQNTAHLLTYHSTLCSYHTARNFLLWAAYRLVCSARTDVTHMTQL